MVKVLFVVNLLFIMACGNNAPTAKKHSTGTIEAAEKASSADKNVKLAEAPKDANAFKPFYIYSDKESAQNHYIPSGFMPDGKCLKFDDYWAESCQEGKSCIKISYDVDCSKQGQKWAGIYWLNPANNWGSRKGGFNLTGATKLTFWARGDKGGERIEEVKIGGLTGDYPDSDTAVIGPIILSPEWKEYSIDLRGKDLSYISGGFAWSTNVDVNPENCIFYFDQIRFE